MRNKGVTILELLIVMAIIGVLAGVFLVNYPGIQKRGRDSQRKSDVKQYQTSLEVFATREGGLYPTSRGNTVNNSALCGYLGLSPCTNDPQDGQANCGTQTCRYLYQTQNCGSSAGDACAANYVIWAPLELPPSGGTTYFVVCSNGNAGEITTGVPPSGGNCPL